MKRKKLSGIEINALIEQNWDEQVLKVWVKRWDIIEIKAEYQPSA